MNKSDDKYVWRCLKCSNHIANINYPNCEMKAEKKCPKCKHLNILELDRKKISTHSFLQDDSGEAFKSEIKA